MNAEDLKHTIEFQMKLPIAMCIERRYYRAALILIYSGIDAMGNLIRGIDKQLNDREDFTRWINDYLQIQGEHQTQINPAEWWSSRCGLLHTQTYLSRDVINGTCRVIGFTGFMNDHQNPTIRYDKSIDPNLVFVSLFALAEAFLIGVDKTINELQVNTTLASVAEERLRNLYINVPVRPAQ